MPSLQINTSATSNSKALSEGERQRIQDYQDALKATAKWQQSITPTFSFSIPKLLPNSFVDEETGQKIQEYLNEGNILSREPSPSADEEEDNMYVTEEEQKEIERRRGEAMPFT